MDKDMKYEVWVGGVVVNDYFLTEAKAKDLAQEYLDDNYDDVEIQVAQ